MSSVETIIPPGKMNKRCYLFRQEDEGEVNQDVPSWDLSYEDLVTRQCRDMDQGTAFRNPKLSDKSELGESLSTRNC